MPFQENPKTGDARVAGTTASLAGVEAGDPAGVDRVLLAHAIALSTGGIPLLYLGDEVAQLNDYSYTDDPATAGDSRWVHRPARPAERYAQRADAATDAGRVYAGLTALIRARQATPEFAGGELIGFDARHPSVLGYQRPGGGCSDPRARQRRRRPGAHRTPTLERLPRRRDRHRHAAIRRRPRRGLVLPAARLRVAAGDAGRLSGGSRAVTPTPERRLGRSLSRPGAAPA